jgi:hypothetical protein
MTWCRTRWEVSRPASRRADRCLAHLLGLLREADGWSLRHPDDVGTDQRGHDLEVEPVQLRHAEPGGGDGRHDVAIGVAASGQPGPGSLQPVLPAGQPRVVGPHVLVEPQRSAGAQDPAGLGQRPGWVGNRAQHQAGDHRVEGGVGEGQVLGPAVEDLDGHPGRPGGLGGSGAHPGAGSRATTRVAVRYRGGLRAVPAPISSTSPAACSTRRRGRRRPGGRRGQRASRSPRRPAAGPGWHRGWWQPPRVLLRDVAGMALGASDSPW